MKYIIIILMFILLSLVYLTFIKPVIISLLFDTDKTDLHMNLIWLYPFIEIKVEMENYYPAYTVYVFKKKLFKKLILKGKQKENNTKLFSYYNCLKLKNSYVKADYSLNDPFSTSITNMIFNIVQSFTDTVRIMQNPNFIADHAYITIEAGTKLNMGRTATQIVKKKFKK